MRAFARIHLRLSWDEALDLTLRQFDVYRKQYEAGQKRRDAMAEFMFAQLTAVVHNLVADKDHRVQTSHFMPSRWEEESKKKQVEPEPDAVVRSWDRWIVANAPQDA